MIDDILKRLTILEDSVAELLATVKDLQEKTVKTRFKAPTSDEVRDYLVSIGKTGMIDPDAFVAFYESKGWKVGNSPMKNWKAAVRTWLRGRSSSNTVNVISDYYG